MIRGVATVALALVVAACGSSSGATPSAAAPAGVALTAGAHTSTAFAPALTFTVPAGWSLEDNPKSLVISPTGSQVVGIYLFRDPVAASQASDCPDTADPSVPADSLSLLTWIRGRKGLNVSSPTLVTVGGLRGTSVDISIADGWTASCPFANGSATVALFAGSYRWVVYGSERMRLFLLDLAGGGTVAVLVDTVDGALSQLLSIASPIVKSFTFASG